MTPSEAPAPSSATAFDRLAPHYDSLATEPLVSRWLRERVRARLAALFMAGDRVLEIGCGTGEDAIWLAQRGVNVTASDVSAAMLDETRRKVQQAGVESAVVCQPLDLGTAADWPLAAGSYDGVFSNFGPLNCVGSWSALGAALARAVRPGGRIGLAVMGPVCGWEIGMNLLRGRWRAASRRWHGQAVAQIDGVSFAVYYPSPRRLQRDLGRAFQVRNLLGLGVFLPTSEWYEAIGRRPELARTLLTMERLTAPIWPFSVMGDHYWLELERI